MTAVARDGKTLAADKRTSFGGLHAVTTKVHRLPDGRLLGCAGNAAQISEMVHWFATGAGPEKLPAIQLDPKECVSVLVIRPGGFVLHYESTAYPIQLENRIWAIGSGRDFAMAAMHLGKDARQAVMLACELDSTCGNGVDTLEL
jgi:ATP-dependent protease HslVU (ClpYQ) peptidase subunit